MDRLYRYLGPDAEITVHAPGCDPQNFLRYVEPDTNLGFRADNEAVASFIEANFADVFDWDGKGS
jgi:hypothetical protein